MRGIGLMAGIAGLAGCMAPDLPGFGPKPEAAEVTRAQGTFAQAQDERGEAHRSQTIDTLIARRTVLPAGSPYAKVADAVLAASARTSEAELMQARMRARAADKNWLPRLGPNISLSSLSGLVASLVLDQVLFDNGRRKAERDFARADVEAAAVALSIDQNERLHTGLGLYLDAEEARARAAAADSALAQMRELDRVMSARVAGGVSDRSESAVVRTKLAQLDAQRQEDIRAAETALAELQAMAAGPVTGVHGTTALSLPGDSVLPLTLLRAGAERDRDVAEAAIQRAGLLPGVSAAAAVSGSGIGGPEVRLTSDQGIGFGLGDNMAALDAAKDAADRRVSQAQEDANRELASLRRTRSAQAAQAKEKAQLAEQTRANATLFTRQFKAGTRNLLEVAGIVETLARAERDAVVARFAVARTEIEIAARLGVLADGSAL